MFLGDATDKGQRVGLEFLTPAPHFWGVDFVPTDWPAPNAPVRPRPILHPELALWLSGPTFLSSKAREWPVSGKPKCGSYVPRIQLLRHNSL